jgi:uncharacterized protein
MTDLATHIQQIRVCDTHEHLHKEDEWVENGPADVLQDLFQNYVPADLISAGASDEAVQRLTAEGDVAERFDGIRAAWSTIRHTGYGEAVRHLATELYGLPDGFGPADLIAAQPKLDAWRQPGGRRRLLEETAGLDHVQTDDFCWQCPPDPSGPDFFFYDISWAGFCNGIVDAESLLAETGIEVCDVGSLREAMAAIFSKHAHLAIAVKAQHAYNRTLRWTERTDAEAATILPDVLRDGEKIPAERRQILGDWCWARGVELAIEHDLPFKLHTGYYAGNNRMPVDRIRPGHLAPLLARYLDCRFVLMHIGYPYSGELVALTKHYRNVYADLCWAWSIDPYSSADFVRRFLHTAPANKLFAFGGDTGWPTSAAAYAFQARQWLTRALQAEVDERLMTETDAIAVADRILRENQMDCFNVDQKKTAAG